MVKTEKSQFGELANGGYVCYLCGAEYPTMQETEQCEHKDAT